MDRIVDRTTGLNAFPDLRTNKVAIGNNAGLVNQFPDAVAIGQDAGNTNQGNDAIAIGFQAGQNNQGNNAVAIGSSAGNLNQGNNGIAFGNNAGFNAQLVNSIAIGHNSGNTNQGDNAVAIGHNAGQSGQGNHGIALGQNAGQTSQGANSIAIGQNAAPSSQHANTTVLNATGTTQATDGTGRFYVNPIREFSNFASLSSANCLFHSRGSKELFGVRVNLQHRTFTNTISPQGEIQITGLSHPAAFLSVPVMLACITEQQVGAGAQNIIVSFFQVTTSTYTLILKNCSTTATVSPLNETYKVGIYTICMN